jgi:hypothetical protein
MGQIYHVIHFLECAIATAILQRQCSTWMIPDVYNGCFELNSAFPAIAHDEFF